MSRERQGDFEDAELGTLSVHDTPAATAERIRTLAHTILAGQRERAAPRSGFAQAYARFWEPALVSGLVVFYLIWAVGRALVFYRFSG